MKHDQERAERPSASDALHWVYWVCSAHALCLAVFIRRRFGCEAFRYNGPVAFIIILLFGAATEAPEMLAFLVVWLVFVAFQRAAAFRRERRGDVVHSRYTGYPWLGLKVPFVRSERFAKGGIEPMLCLIVGPLVMPLSEPLGLFILLGTFTMLFQVGTDRQIDIMRVRRLRDSQIEQRHLTSMFRGNDF